MAVVTQDKYGYPVDKKDPDNLPFPVGTTTSPSTANSRRNLTVLHRTFLFFFALLFLSYRYVPEEVFSRLHHHSHKLSGKGSWRDERSVRSYYAAFKDLAATPSQGRGKEEAELEKLFLSVPDSESARKASHSYTNEAHVAGTEGDRLSSLLVKAQWESLLSLPVTSPETNIFEAGTRASREALMGKAYGCGKRENKAERQEEKFVRKATKWIKRVYGMRFSVGIGKGNMKSRVWVDTYWPLLNYPVSHSLTMTPSGASSPSFVAKLIEDDVPEDKTSKNGRTQVPTFHGFSKNGTAKGHLIYAGRGTKVEFDSLVLQGINFTDSIVLVQYSGSFRGLKVGAATSVGASAVLIYTDPAEDGEITLENGYEAYPNGPARQPSSVQRGSVQFLSSYPGDPLTPFVPAYKDTKERLPRDDPEINIPSIPSLPISYEDALPLLKSLNGKGIKMGKDNPEGFKEGGLGYLGVEYWSGPGEEIVEVVNIMEDKVTPIWNTMAVIPGKLKDEVIILGNHNDAWTFGAGDPNSGTASVHEIVKALGVLLKTGWVPLRTIVVASWDAEEYGLIGSTEFGEDFSTWLKDNVVAYLNVDVSVSGTSYGIGASPSLASLFKDVSGEIIDPDQTNRSLLTKMYVEGPQDQSEGFNSGDAVASEELHVGPLGSGSDFTVFLQHLGIASVNVGYSRKRTDPVYHYHSIYDSQYWMDTFGDPTFERHIAVAKVLGLATLRLTNSLLLPLNITAYAQELSFYSAKIHKLSAGLSTTAQLDLGLAALDSSIECVQTSASHLAEEIKEVEHELKKVGINGQERKVKSLMRRVRSINRRAKEFERGFIDVEGLPGRKWYRSIVVAPGRDLGYGATTFPAVTEALVLDHDEAQAKKEVKRLVKAFEKIAHELKKE